MRGGGLCLVALAAALIAAPAAAAGAVTAWDASGKRPTPCPAIDAGDPRKLRGGCEVEMDTRGIAIVIRSVVGDMPFGTCFYSFDMRVDGSGRTYLEEIAVGGPSPCNDMKPCDNDDPKPWRGRIEAAPDGRLSHVVDACFDTCMGQFVGELRLGLERVDGRWTLTADRALTGSSGYQIDGSWRTEQRDLDIRPNASAGGDAAGAWRLTGEPVGWPI